MPFTTELARTWLATVASNELTSHPNPQLNTNTPEARITTTLFRNRIIHYLPIALGLTTPPTSCGSYAPHR
jgi:hypothetical protein